MIDCFVFDPAFALLKGLYQKPEQFAILILTERRIQATEGGRSIRFESPMPNPAGNSYAPRTVKYTLKDVGAEFIDQLSSDVYPSPGAIIRELVKNAYDAYLDLLDENPSALTDLSLDRQVLVRCNRDDKAVGRIFVSDYGIGLTFKELKTFLQIGVSPKKIREALQKKIKGKKLQSGPARMGFRGLGTWAMIGGGSKIIITTKKFGTNNQSKLTIDTREVYSNIGAHETLDSILNNKACVLFEERRDEELPHGTTIEIVCDRPTEKINGYELNKLFEYTEVSDDGDAQALRNLLVQVCPIPYKRDGNRTHAKIHAIYKRCGYHPTAVVLNGTILEREIPPTLTLWKERTITINDKPVALAWTVEHPDQSKTVKVDEKYLTGGPSIQICRLNVPIGEKGLFRPQIMKEFVLRRYVGEIQILNTILPDASGDNIRSSAQSKLFRERVQDYYKNELETEAATKSAITGVRSSFEQFQSVVSDKKTKRSKLEELEFLNKVKDAVEAVDKFHEVQAAADESLITQRNEVRAALDKHDWYKTYSKKKNSPKRVKSVGKKKPDKPERAKALVDPKEFQRRLTLANPKLRSLGLDQEQIDEIFRILEEVFFK